MWGLMCVCLVCGVRGVVVWGVVCGVRGVVVWGVGSVWGLMCVCLVCGVRGVVVWGVGSDVCVFMCVCVSVWCPWGGGVGCGV